MVLIRAVLAVLLSAVACRAERVVLSAPEDVEDVPLVGGEFGAWNFGGSPLLEVGYMGGIYTEHHATSLVRFDVRSAGIAEASGGVIRLYKPKDFIQLRPVRVVAYAVTGRWEEGASIFSDKGVKGNDVVAHDAKPFASVTVSDGEAAWVEFPVPRELVQRWLNEPKSNDGVLLAAEPGGEKEWGDHVYFYSSEHYLGKTPQLVIEGTAGAARWTVRKEPKGRLLALPGEGMLEGWLKGNDRLAKFAKDLKCTPAQARVFQLFDTAVRDRLIVGRYQGPFHEVIGEIPALVEKHDEAAIRGRLATLHELLLTWEYIRETCWYTSGPLADVLSPGQLNRFFAGEIFGTMESSANAKSKEIWRVIPAEGMPAHNREVMADLTKRHRLSAEQAAYLAPRIGEFEAQENRYLGLFRDDLARCQAMMKADADGPEVFAAVRALHLHHEKFLYYQSIYNTPRWTLFVGHVPIEPFAAWVAEARKSHYDRAVSGANKRGAAGVEPEN